MIGSGGPEKVCKGRGGVVRGVILLDDRYDAMLYH